MTPVAKTPWQGRSDPPEDGNADKSQDGRNQRLAALASGQEHANDETTQHQGAADEAFHD